MELGRSGRTIDHAAAAAPAAMDRISYGVGCASTALAKPQHHTDPLSRSSLSIDARSVSGATRWRRLLAALADSILAISVQGGGA
jgi:hypothetical protein